jgi:WD40 repeat protein
LRVIHELAQSTVQLAKFSFDKDNNHNTSVLTVTAPGDNGQVTMRVYRITTNETMLECTTIDRFGDATAYNFAAGSEYLLYPNEGDIYKHDLLRSNLCEKDTRYKAIGYNTPMKQWVWLQGSRLSAGLDGYPRLRTRALANKLYNEEMRGNHISFSPNSQYWLLESNFAEKLNIRRIAKKAIQDIATLDLYCRNSNAAADSNCPNKRQCVSIFSPSGKYILTLAPNGAVKLWHFDRALIEKTMADIVE